MIPRRLLSTLVFTLPISAVVFGVVAGAALLADGLGDAGARAVFRGIAALALIILTTDLVLLTTVLGLELLARGDRPVGSDLESTVERDLEESTDRANRPMGL